MRSIGSVFFVLWLMSTAEMGFAQSRGVDTSYVSTSPALMNLRAYFSKKYTNVDFGNSVGVYEPNSGLNFGLGVTYQKFTLNIGVPLSFLNPDRQQDWPTFWDLQVHAYPNRWMIDFFGQFYNGYMIKGFQEGGEAYLRRDMRVRKIGAGASYLFNGDQISFEAAFLQSAIQKRSAFSPMLGFEVYRVRISGDSLLLPVEEPVMGNYTRGDFFQVGPSGGLVGTVVFGNGFFLTGAASVNLGLGHSKADRDKSTRQFDLMPGYFLRGFAGYNGERFSVNANYVYKQVNLARQQDVSQAANTGNYRLNFIYKIHPGPKLNKTYTKLNPWNILHRMFD